jgi:hypothetical protein
MTTIIPRNVANPARAIVRKYIEGSSAEGSSAIVPDT